MTPVLILAAVVLAGCLAAVFVLRLPMWAAAALFLAANCCLGVHFFGVDFGPFPITIDRLLLVLLVVGCVVRLKCGDLARRPWTIAETVLLAFLGMLTVSVLVHGWAVDSPDDISPLWRLIVAYYCPALVYFVARHVSTDGRSLTALYAFLAALGLYLAATGMLEMAGQWSLVFPGYIADPEVGLHFGRARGPMVNSVSYGLYLSVCLLAGLLWLSSLGRPGHLAAVAFAALVLGAVWLSFTRSVYIGAGLGLVVILLPYLKRRVRPVAIAALAAAVLLVGATKWDSLLGMEREYSGSHSEESANLRVSFAYVSWLMFQDQPLTGVGFGQYFDAKDPYLQDRSTELELDAIRGLIHHNYFLGLLTETGLAGLALYLAMLGCWVRRSWQLVTDSASAPWMRRQGVLMLGAIAVLVPNALFHEVSYMTVVPIVMFFMAGLTMGIAPAGAALAREPQSAPGPAPLVRRALAT